MSASPIRVVLVDDHQIVVESFSALLDLVDDFEVVATATTAEEGVDCVLRTRPDIALFDVDFPGRDSFDVIPELTRLAPDTRVAFLTGHVSDVFIHQAVRMGTHGYLLKGEPSAEICQALRQLHAGEFAFSQTVRDRLKWDSDEQRYSVRTENSLCALSLQQLAILRHLARGESVKEIAVALDRSEKSIDSHKYRIMHRLGIHDRVELCRYAIREGLTLV